MRKVAGIAAAGALLVVSIGLALAGCGSGGDTPTTTTGAGVGETGAETTVATGSSDGNTIVGGKSKEEYEKAVTDLGKQLESSPQDLAMLQDLAVAYYQTGQYDEAAKTYEKMLGVKDDPMTRNNYANVLRDWDKATEAKAEYEKALTGDPTLTVAYINLASVWAREGNAAEAVKVLDRGIAKVAGEDTQRLESYKKQLTDTQETQQQ